MMGVCVQIVYGAGETARYVASREIDDDPRPATVHRETARGEYPAAAPYNWLWREWDYDFVWQEEEYDTFVEAKEAAQRHAERERMDRADEP